MLKYAFAPLMRHDTMLGVCQAIGDDFGFNANLLRLALPVVLFLAPVATIAGYLGVGVIVLLTRLIVGEPRVASAEAVASTPVEANDAEQAELLLAA